MPNVCGASGQGFMDPNVQWSEYPMIRGPEGLKVERRKVQIYHKNTKFVICLSIY